MPTRDGRATNCYNIADRDGFLFDTVDGFQGRQPRMKKSISAVVAAVITAVGLFVIADAMAQLGGGMPGAGKRGARMDKGSAPGTSRPAAQENVTALIEFRLALLQEDLKLTREQERAWAAYEDRVKALAADISRERGRTQSAMSMNAMEQVNHAVDMARNRLTAWEEIASAAKALYNGLAPQQKTLADQRFPSVVLALTGGGAAVPGPKLERPLPDSRGPGPAPGMETK